MLCADGKGLKKRRDVAHLNLSDAMKKTYIGVTREKISQLISPLQHEFDAANDAFVRHKQACHICDE